VDGRDRLPDAEADAEEAAAASSIARGNPRPPRALPPAHDELGAESLRLKKMNKDWWGRGGGQSRGEAEGKRRGGVLF